MASKRSQTQFRWHRLTFGGKWGDVKRGGGGYILVAWWSDSWCYDPCTAVYGCSYVISLGGRTVPDGAVGINQQSWSLWSYLPAATSCGLLFELWGSDGSQMNSQWERCFKNSSGSHPGGGGRGWVIGYYYRNLQRLSQFNSLLQA